MIRIFKFLSKLFICVLCICCISGTSFANSNLLPGEITEYGNWLNEGNIATFNTDISSDFKKFEPKIDLTPTTFVPLEAKFGFMLMKALSALDSVLQMSLIRFTIIFLLTMYVFWCALKAYKMMRESTDYKTVLYDIFKQGCTIVVWIIILRYGPAKIFSILVSPIITLGAYFSDFILSSVAETYKISIPDTCATITDYVNTNNSSKLLIDADAAAKIMCLPSRLSVFFYHAVKVGFSWILNGFGHSAIMVIVGVVSVVMFILCIFKYAFMTLGVVVDLFLTLLLLPFTAIAESLPSTDSKSKGYLDQILGGLLKIFNTKKLSEVITVFISATIYFISLSIIIAICAALLSRIIALNESNEFVVGSAMTTILTGCLVLYLASSTGKLEDLIKKIGGSINNTFGKTLQSDAKILIGKAKNIGMKLFKEWLKH